MGAACIAARRVGAGAVYLVLVTAMLAFLSQAGAPSHSHESAAAGVYNAECPLQLVAHHPDGSSPSPLPSTWTGVVGALPHPVALATAPAPFALQLGSRAPPARLI